MTNKPGDYSKLVKSAAYVAVMLSLIQIVIKFYAWSVTDASALLASATDSLLDLATSLINLLLLRVALKPADDNHKFGHGKAESLAALFQSAFVLGAAVLLIFQGIQQLLNPSEVKHLDVGVIITLMCLGLTLGLVMYQRYVVKKTQSLAIDADALHYQSDVLLNVGVLLSLVVSVNWWAKADGVFTLAVAIMLIGGAIKIVKRSVEQLMDHELSEEHRTNVFNIVGKYSQVKGMHDLRSRQSGPVKFIQLHIELEQHLSLKDAHNIADRIKKEIEHSMSPCEVLIHLDPWFDEANQ